MSLCGRIGKVSKLHQSKFVASQSVGLPTDLLGEDEPHCDRAPDGKRKYISYCDKALDDFFNRYSPCALEDCCNVKSGHNPKGHQDSKGKIFAPGEYKPGFEPNDREEWHSALRHNLEEIERKLQESFQAQRLVNKNIPEETIASRLHRECMNRFYAKLGGAENFKSNIICFSCLQELPEHVLPCGHVLCTPCIHAYGRRERRTLITIDSCPLHGTTWPKRCRIKVKPEYAGTRILSLDG